MLKKLLISNGYKSIEENSNVFVNRDGDVLSYSINKKGIEGIKKITIGLTDTNVYKFNTIGKCLLLHNVIYKTFKGNFQGILQFIDGDKKNYKLENLITIENLLISYRKNN